MASASRKAFQSDTSAAGACSASSVKKRSAASRSLGSPTHAGPPSASQTPRTAADSGMRPRSATNGAMQEASRCSRCAPSSDMSSGLACAGDRCATIASHKLPPPAAASSAKISGSVRPHHGARSTASHASRSCGLDRARASALRDRESPDDLPADRGRPPRTGCRLRCRARKNCVEIAARAHQDRDLGASLSASRTRVTTSAASSARGRRSSVGGSPALPAAAARRERDVRRPGAACVEHAAGRRD